MIELLPLGRVDDGLVNELGESLGKIFRTEVRTKEPVNDIVRFYDEGRDQYCSSLILQYMGSADTEGRRGSRTLAVIGEDLSTPILTFVFGEAEYNGRAAIVSYYRLRPEMYGLPANRTLVVNRLLKEAAHELGHTFGLVHCLTQHCVMHASTYVEDLELKTEKFCSTCDHLIHPA